MLNQNLTAEKIIKSIESSKDEIRNFGVKKSAFSALMLKKARIKEAT